jgi:hypothetical protein
MTPSDLGRKFGRGARLAAAPALAVADLYRKRPFTVTFALLAPALVWFAIVIGTLELLRGGPLPADPAQAFADGVGAGLLIGTVATFAALGVLYLIARRRRAK